MPDGSKILWTKTAREDLFEIVEYIKLDSAAVALKILENIESNVRRLVDFPEHGRVVPELKELNVYQYREIVVSPWRVIYRVDKRKIYIMAVIDGRRDVADVLLNRQLR
jgi:toxin ParE1/3/4